MKRIKDIRGAFKKLFFPFQIYLGIFFYRDLIEIEKLLGTSLGSYKRNSRPFLFWFDNNKNVFLIFLTASRITVPVDLNYCSRKRIYCPNYYFLSESFLFADQEGKPVIFTLPSLKIIENAHFCGSCENLNHLITLQKKA
ncbi:MAG: hypothetical protein J7K20_07520 [Thermodesulfobacterium sp.]|nr:hypothetical protein [Thermodesulfobacterium sp.]